MSEYGLTLYASGYPPIVINNLVPYMTLGSRGMSYLGNLRTQYPEQVSTFTYPVTPPAGSSIYVTNQVDTYDVFEDYRWNNYGEKNGRTSIGGSSASVGYYPCGVDINYQHEIITGAFCSAVADLSAVTSTGAYGLFIKNNGLSSVLNNATPPSAVVRRIEIPIAAGTKEIYVDIPELQTNLHNNIDVAVFAGCKNNEVGAIASIRPRNPSWLLSSGGRLHCRFFNPALGHGSVNDQWQISAPKATTLYVLVTGAGSQSVGGYGIAIYGSAGKVSLSTNRIPALLKGVVFTKPFPLTERYNATPYLLGNQASIPPTMASSDTFLLMVGGSKKMGLNHYTITSGQNGWVKIGYTYTWVYGGVVRTGMFYRKNVGTIGVVSNGFATGSWTSNQNRADPVPCIRGEDYFLSLN